MATTWKSKGFVPAEDAAASAMLAALKTTRDYILDPKTITADDLLKIIYTAWDQAEAAGIKAAS